MCNHEKYQIKYIMDFSFCVCDNCNFQWKGTEPFQKTETIDNKQIKDAKLKV